MSDENLSEQIDTVRSKLMRRDGSLSQYERKQLQAQLLELTGKQMAERDAARAGATATEQARLERAQRIDDLSEQLRSGKPEERSAARKALDEMAAAERAGEQSNT